MLRLAQFGVPMVGRAELYFGKASPIIEHIHIWLNYLGNLESLGKDCKSIAKALLQTL
jgi:hypothetical protein